ncbi:hypothetical protein [Mycoplasmoides pirum]|uniref:hypothetical protein n=1 Tax=Mycoplasmoides pirum TaxID=2122 RepID=UPI000486DCF2|nr:hypothetical protein [Mycoplasmoides pirum]
MYKYRNDFNPNYLGVQLTSSRKARGIIFRDPKQNFANYYYKSLDPLVAQTSFNTYLTSLGLPELIFGLTSPMNSVLNGTDIVLKERVLKIANDYQLDLNPDPLSGRFWAIMEVVNANILGDKRRDPNPFEYVYYVNDIEGQATSKYLVQFEAPVKQYNVNSDLIIKNNKILINNKSQDTINQLGLASQLEFDIYSHNWTDIVKNGLENNVAISLEINNPYSVGFGTEQLLTLGTTTPEIGILNNNLAKSFIELVNSLTSSNLKTNSNVSYTANKNSITFTFNPISDLTIPPSVSIQEFNNNDSTSNFNLKGINYKIGSLKVDMEFTNQQTQTMIFPYKITFTDTGIDIKFDFNNGIEFKDLWFFTDKLAQQSFSNALLKFIQSEFKNNNINWSNNDYQNIIDYSQILNSQIQDKTYSFVIPASVIPNQPVVDKVNNDSQLTIIMSVTIPIAIIFVVFVITGLIYRHKSKYLSRTQKVAKKAKKENKKENNN